MKDLCEGLTPAQEKYIAKELGVYAKERHQAYAKLLQRNPNDKQLQIKTIAWEYVCQNLGLDGYDWS